MRALTLCGTSAAAMILLTFPTITLGAGIAGANPGATGVTRVPLDADLKNCDFSLTRNPPMVPGPMLGTGWAEIIHTGSSAVAQVHLDAPERAGRPLRRRPDRGASTVVGDVRSGDPGTSFTGLDTDAGGVGTATVQDSLRSDTTGVWVIIERPSAHSHDPAEYYTSEFVAPV